MNAKVSIGNVIKLAGAYIAVIIGSGFATGQEIMQFYTSYGIWSFGSILVSLFLFSWVGGSVMKLGYTHRNDTSIGAYQRICGKYIGTFFEYFMLVILFAGIVVMFSGAGATLQEYYGINHVVGSMGMAILVFIASSLGVRGLINILGPIGPVIIIFTIGIGVVTVLQNIDNLSNVSVTMENMELAQASASWWLAGLFYAAFNLSIFIVFLYVSGSTAQSSKEAMAGGILGGVALVMAVFFLNLAFLSRIEDVASLAIPTLYLADSISPLLGVLFSVILLSGIFSTAAPMMWTLCEKIVPEGTRKFKVVAGVLTSIALFCGQLPFGTLIGILYPCIGYFGLVVFVCLLVTQIRNCQKS